MLRSVRIGFLLILIALCAGDEFVVDAESGRMTMPKSCQHLCKQGACLFKDCSYTRCPGGACHFIDCKYPSCSGEQPCLAYVIVLNQLTSLNFSGGACVFERCIGATCDGGRYTQHCYVRHLRSHVYFCFIFVSAVRSETPRKRLKPDIVTEEAATSRERITLICTRT